MPSNLSVDAVMLIPKCMCNCKDRTSKAIFLKRPMLKEWPSWSTAYSCKYRDLSSNPQHLSKKLGKPSAKEMGGFLELDHEWEPLSQMLKSHWREPQTSTSGLHIRVICTLHTYVHNSLLLREGGKQTDEDILCFQSSKLTTEHVKLIPGWTEFSADLTRNPNKSLFLSQHWSWGRHLLEKRLRRRPHTTCQSWLHWQANG